MKRVAIMISGAGSNMVALAESMTGDHPARPVLVLSNEPAAPGLERARALGIPTRVVDHREYADRSGFEAAMTVALRAARPDLIALAGFMRLLSPPFVATFSGRMLNIHPSLLPKYRGLDTHARALAAGESETGCTVHEVTAALDDGPTLGQGRVPVRSGDTAETLAARVREMEHRLYPAVLRRVAEGNRNVLFLP